MDQIRILVADEHLTVREGTCTILRREPDCQVVAQAASGAEALTLAETSPPDVIVIDSALGMPQDGVVLKRLRQLAPQAAVLVLVTYDDQCYLDAIMQAGADACLLRNARCHELVGMVRQVARQKSLAPV